MTNRTEICSCAGCRETLFEGDDLVQNPVIKCGELSYIELAHRTCQPTWAVNDDFDFSPYEADDFDAQDVDAVVAAYEQREAPRATLADLWPS